MPAATARSPMSLPILAAASQLPPLPSKPFSTVEALQSVFAAEVRAKRPPEPYKGKGIKYDYEHIRRKEGKTGAK